MDLKYFLKFSFKVKMIFRCSGIQVFRHSGIQVFRHSFFYYMPSRCGNKMFLNGDCITDHYNHNDIMVLVYRNSI
jgi:hypothetical protein